MAVELAQDDPYRQYDANTGAGRLDVQSAFGDSLANENAMNGRPASSAPSGMKTEQDFKNALGGLYDPNTYTSYVANVSNNGGGDPTDWFNRIVAKESLRGSNEPNSTYTPDNKGGYTTGPTGTINRGPGQPKFSSGRGDFGAGTKSIGYDAQFSDPISAFLEQFASQQRERLTNPPSGSGQQLYEDILKNISQQFQGGGYTAHEQELLNTQALDPLERLRSARKQQVITNLSARGIGPDSGVYKDMLADVDRQFDSLRAQQQTQLGVNAANQATQRQLTAIQLLQQLAGTEGQRNDQAFNYASVPYNMAQTAFGNASGFYGATGNPLALIQPLLALQSQQQGQSASQQQALGYLAYLLANMGA